VKATEVTAGLAESNGRLLPGLWRDSLHITCGLTACTPGSAPGPTLGNEYGKTLPFTFTGFQVKCPEKTERLLAVYRAIVDNVVTWRCLEENIKLKTKGSHEYNEFLRETMVCRQYYR